MASALDSAATADVGPAAFVRGVERLVRVRPDEAGALLWACAYNFALLSAWYVLRPLRDELGIVGGTKNLPWLFTATLVAMFLANPLFGALVARWPRRRFIPAVYRFFQVNLLLFAVLLLTLPENGAGSRRSRVLCLGQRVQPVRAVRVLGLHGGPVLERAGRTAVRRHRRRRHAGRDRRRSGGRAVGASTRPAQPALGRGRAARGRRPLRAPTRSARTTGKRRGMRMPPHRQHRSHGPHWPHGPQRARRQ